MAGPGGLIENIGYLKLELLTKGMRLDRSALRAPEVATALEIGSELKAPLELNLILPGNVLINIAVKECLNNDSCYFLSRESDGFYIKNNDASLKVELAPPPRLYRRRTASGKLMAAVGRVYGNYLLITPSGACEFLQQDLACRYCDVEAKKAPDKSIDEVLETAAAALEEGAAEYICFNVGYAESEDGGIASLLPYIKAVKENLDALICIQAQPPRTNKWIDATYAAGVDSLAYNLEVYDSDIFARIAPGKMKLLGRERYLKALARAAKVFPAGAVVSNLIIGLEPVASTIKGIDALTSIGVVPTLPLIRPLPGGDIQSCFELVPENIAPIFIHLEKALRRRRLAAGWISHFNIVVNAIDAHLFSSQTPLRKPRPSLYSAKKHNKLALNLRRRLRVKATGNNESGGI